MLKKLTLLIALLAVALTACSSAQPLDSTSQAVTQEQAAELIPLWQVYKQLTSSDTAAQAELDGLSTQIKEAMTAEQLKAISDLKLTQSDMMSYMQQARPQSKQQGSSSSSTSSGNGNSGGVP